MSLKESRRIVPIPMAGVLVALAIMLLVSQPTRAAGPWYVDPGGNDSSDCQSPASPCASINGAIGKAIAGDTIYIAIGTYTGTGDEVVLIDKDITLSGGWDDSFSTQGGTSSIDGGDARRCIHINEGLTAIIEHFAVSKGDTDGVGGGIHNGGALTLRHTTVSGNRSNEDGGGIFNGQYATLTLDHSTVSGNRARRDGGGIYSDYYNEETVLLYGSTVSGNRTGRNGGGILNWHCTLILEHSTVSGNTASRGGGIFSLGSTTLNHSTVSGNTASASDGGIENEGTLTLIGSTVRGNTATESGGGIGNDGTLTLTNSTVSGNMASQGGGIHQSDGTLLLSNATVSDNSAGQGGGIRQAGGTVDLRNTVLAGNSAGTGPDCSGSIVSRDYNLIGDVAGCSLTPGTGDLTGLGANLGQLIGEADASRYHPLLAGSPAIDAGDPTGCADHLGNHLDSDQRGASRVGRCDIGAYEYTTPGPAASVAPLEGTPQRTPPSTAFWVPLRAVVLDGIGSPVHGATVSLSAPATGASGTFADNGTSTTDVVTSESGAATAARFTANDLGGSYTVTATVSGVVTPAHFLLSNFGWYVAPGGTDMSDCQTPATPCATVNGVLGKDAFLARDTVLVATGLYTGGGDEVVLLDNTVRLRGGWNGTFTTQSGNSTIDGDGTRRGLTVESGVTAIVERFTLQEGSPPTGNTGGGVNNEGTLLMNSSTIRQNRGAGVHNGTGGALTLNNSTVSDNMGGGIYNRGTVTLNGSTAGRNRNGGIWTSGTLTLNGSTVSSNTADEWDRGSGISIGNGSVTLNNSTVSGNATGIMGGGIYIFNPEFTTVTLQNTILAENSAGDSPDCSRGLVSLGHNLIGDTTGCHYTPGTGDLTNVSPSLGQLIGKMGAPRYHPLLGDSPAIDAGNPSGCTDHLGNPLEADQRGAARVGRCDIGAYEYTTPGPAAAVSALDGTPQRTTPSTAFWLPLKTVVLDSIGSPASNASVHFAAPPLGVSGTFVDSGTSAITSVSDENGIAGAGFFVANNLEGSYTVTATTSGVLTPARFLLSHFGWYATPGGSDTNDCQTPATPCATINGTLEKDGFLAGDTVLVTEGTYTGSEEEVVLLDKKARLSGGWDDTFTTHTGTSAIDGEASRRGITVNSGVMAHLERFTVRNGSDYHVGGIRNAGTLTLEDCIIRGNVGSTSGGGIYNGGALTLNRCAVTDNATTHYSTSGGGILSDGILTLNSTTVSGNTTRAGGSGAGIRNNGFAALNNSTISGNGGGQYGGGIYNVGVLVLNNSTVTGNRSEGAGGGIHHDGISVTMQNSILAGNTLGSAPGTPSDCYPTFHSAGYNLVGDTAHCTFTPGPGDQTVVDARLLPLIGVPEYHPLQPDSPAIDAGNPAGCMDHLGNPLHSDQRGAARVGLCDIGAYEYTSPGPAASIYAFGGTPQRTPPRSTFGMPLQAAVLDSVGSPVNNATVTFSAPASGASGTFADSGAFTMTAVTDGSSIATAAMFTANSVEGAYTVTATVSGVSTPAHFLLSNFGWYVVPGGDDENDCHTPATPCATINGALKKAGFIAADTVLVGSGTYTGTGDPLVLLDKSVRLLGGFNHTFTTQKGTSIIDGEGSHRGFIVYIDVTAMLERFTVQNGVAGEGGGIYNWGTLTLNNSAVRDNRAEHRGGGMHNDGTLTLNNSTVSGNTAERGGGIRNDDGTLILNNSTVSGNTGRYGGGIRNYGTVTLQNTILAGNVAEDSPDCSGSIASSGYNLIGNVLGCTFASTVGDLTNTNAKLGPLQRSPSCHPLLPGSPAINAGNPAGCMGSTGLLATDQRGFPRFGICDIGAYELQPIGFSTKTANRAKALPGDTLTYTITLNNPGTTSLTNVRVTDALPISVTYAADSLTATGGSHGYSHGVITWTGSLNPSGVEAITFGATISPELPIGTFLANSAVISGGLEVFTRTSTVLIPAYAHLPLCTRYYCPDFFDDFGEPASGWAVIDTDSVRSEYLNGEFRILTKQAGNFYLFSAPTCDRNDYEVEVDARWVGNTGNSYGLLFGISGDWDQHYHHYYLFDINTDDKLFRLYRRDPGGFDTIVPPTNSEAINAGTASNHLKVTRDGDQITLAVNGTVLGTWTDAAIGGRTGAGLVSSPYSDRPVSDARFDNFYMVSLPGSGASAQGPSGVMAEKGGLAVPNARRDPAPIELGW